MNTTEPMPQEQLDAIRRRVDTATKGPWMEGTRCVFTEDYEYAIVSDSLVEGPGATPYGEAVQNPADVALIAHAPEDLTALLAEVERRRAQPTVTKDMVERGVRAFYEHPTPGVDASLRPNWDRLVAAHPDVADSYRRYMTAALNAALNPGEVK